MDFKAKVRQLLAASGRQNEKTPSLNLEAAAEQMTAGLRTMSELESINRVALATGTNELGPGMIIFLETSSRATAVLRALQPYEYPGGAWMGVVSALSSTMEARRQTGLRLCHNELCCLAYSGFVNRNELGVEMDNDRQLLRVPATALESNHAWGDELLSMPWFNPAEGHVGWIQICATPSLIPAKLNKQELGLLIELSYGWNHSLFMSPELRDNTIAEYCKFMARAQIIW